MINLFKSKKKLNLKHLPSMGLFYPDNFEIYIKKCNKKYIEEYKIQLETDSLNELVKTITRVIIDNSSFNKKYCYRDIMSIDLFFIFLEICKFTTGKELKLDLKNGETIDMNQDTFDYFNDEKVLDQYNSELKCFEINGYKLTPPTTGVEEDLTDLLYSISNTKGSEDYEYYSYDFLYVLKDKSSLTVEEILNLIQIFNYDIDKKESEKLKQAIEQIKPIKKYNLKYKNELIPISSNINLFEIFD